MSAAKERIVVFADAPPVAYTLDKRGIPPEWDDWEEAASSKIDPVREA